ncbi:MAG TPA: hypothetical protein VH916_07130 [Dehalococcoidia bacterium]|jgi:hypothetical protein
MTAFHKAMIYTAGPIAVLSLLSTAGTAAQGLYNLWFLGLLGWALTIPAMVGFAIAGKQKVIAGIAVGAAIGFVALGCTCFVNLALYHGTA